MGRFIRIFFIVFFTLVVSTAPLFGMGLIGGGGGKGGNEGGGGGNTSPEIDPSLAPTAIAILVGGLIILRGRSGKK